MTYRRAIVPTHSADLPRFLDRELREIGNALDAERARTPVRVLSAGSQDEQSPTGLGEAAAIRLTLGPAQGTTADPVHLDAAGIVHVSQAGTYQIELELHPFRATATASAILGVRLLRNGLQHGVALAAVLTGSGDLPTVHGSWFLDLVGGDDLQLEVGRDPAGEDDGGLRAYTSAMGWGIAPAVALFILKH